MGGGEGLCTGQPPSGISRHGAEGATIGRRDRSWLLFSSSLVRQRAIFRTKENPAVRQFHRM